jgi:hypothetical protein
VSANVVGGLEPLGRIIWDLSKENSNTESLSNSILFHANTHSPVALKVRRVLAGNVGRAVFHENLFLNGGSNRFLVIDVQTNKFRVGIVGDLGGFNLSRCPCSAFRLPKRCEL